MGFSIDSKDTGDMSIERVTLEDGTPAVRITFRTRTPEHADVLQAQITDTIALQGCVQLTITSPGIKSQTRIDPAKLKRVV